MANDTTSSAIISTSSIFLSVVCALLVLASIIFNFTFTLLLFKTRRLNRLDKSNFFLTHLILVDFICSLFVIFPSGYGIYKGTLGFDGCRVQTFFYTLGLSMTFQGLLVISIERWIKYQFPIWHINNFTQRLKFDENDNLITKVQGHKTFGIIFLVWLLNIFIAFIPFFGNYGDIQYFYSQSQCDYIYEKFNWWLWIYFMIFMTLPFFASLVFFFMAFRKIHNSARIIKMKKAQYDIDETGRRRNSSERNMAENVIEGLDVTRQPGSKIYYSHILDPDSVEEENEFNDFHIRNQLLALFKYDSEKSKTITFFIITVISYCIIFPIFVIHFYRAYNNTKTSADGTYDNTALVSRNTYTAFAWISYFTFILKAFLCLTQNKFYRHALYQSANVRGFAGYFDFEKELKTIQRKLKVSESKA